MGPRPLLRAGLAAACLAAAAGASAPAAVAAGEVPGRIVVRFDPSAGPADRSAARAAVDGDLVGSVVPGMQVLAVPVGTEAAAAAELAAGDDTTWAQPDVPARVAAVPDDPAFADQWALRNTGQFGGTPGADVDALGAWDVSRGAGILVGIVDTGVSGHPDAGAQAANAGEIAGNGLDDDRNGLVDDVAGWDFVGADDAPVDDNGHGTAVASVVNAPRDNGRGMAGIAPLARILPVKVLGADGTGFASDVASGMDYAARQGATIVNVSISGPAFQGYTDVVALHPGVLFVVAAGNNGQDNDGLRRVAYPCAEPAPNVLCVGASTATDAMAAFSGRGARSVDLLAPGRDVAGHTLGGGVSLWTGTSFSSPLTAGVAALVRARTPSATTADLKRAVLASAEPVPGAAGTTVSGGRLDALRALGVLEPAAGFAPLAADPPGLAPAADAPAGQPPAQAVAPAPVPPAADEPAPAPASQPAPAGPRAGTGTPAPAPPRRASPARAAWQLKVTRRGRAILPVSCPAPRCAVVVRLYASTASTAGAAGVLRAGGASAARSRLVGSGRATVGRVSRGVSVALTPRGRRLLAARGRLRVVVEIRTGPDVVRRDADLRRG
jgi:subtilisin family serine protease